MPIKVGDEVRLMIPFKVFRIFPDGRLDICDNDGDCISVNPNQVLILTQSNMKAMKDACLAVATQLAKANNTVTTLEIKNELRRDYPYYFWTQDAVSKIMDSLAGDGVFSYTDNGTYRTYRLAKAVTKTPVKVSKTLSKSITVKAGKNTANTVSVVSLGGGQVKVQKTKINWNRLIQLAANPQFAGVTLANGQTVSKQDIKNQKKSPVGYINPKLGRIKSIVVGNIQYNVQ